MRAVVIPAAGSVGIADAPDPVAGPGEVVVELRAAALNHRDVWIKTGQYAGLRFPCIPGSDGAGVVAATGAGVESSWRGCEVVINPSLDWGADEAAQGADFSILGLPRAGTLATQIAIPAAQLERKPEHLDWNEAAALPLAGLTAYRAVATRGRLRRNERVLVSGIGGGTAIFALQFAVAHGAEVWVTSSSPAKIARAVALGARGGFDYNRADWVAEAIRTAGHFDLVVDSAGGPGFESLIDLAAPGGRIVFFGATRGNPPGFPMRKVFWRQISILGTTMGSPADWRAMVDFAAAHRIAPVVDAVYPLERAAEAFARMEAGAQFGKIVVSL